MIEIKGRFKSVDMFNQTIHLILYANDLKAVAELQEIEVGKEVSVRVTEYEDRRLLCMDCKEEIKGTIYRGKDGDRCEACHIKKS